MGMIKKQVEFGQSIFDLGLQNYGHVTGWELIVKDNPQYCITDVPVPGSEYLVRDVVPRLSDTNEAVVAEYKALRPGKETETKVASGLLTNLTMPGEYVEPGYWATGYTR